jgi:hypothetical protein
LVVHCSVHLFVPSSSSHHFREFGCGDLGVILEEGYLKRKNMDPLSI